MAAVYLDQETFSGGKSSPCQPAYHVAATTSSPTVLFLLVELEPEDVLEPAEVDVEEARAAPVEVAGLREHMGAAQTEASGRAARRVRGILNIVNRG